MTATPAATSADRPHVVFTGAMRSGKTTRWRAVIQEAAVDGRIVWASTPDPHTMVWPGVRACQARPPGRSYWTPEWVETSPLTMIGAAANHTRYRLRGQRRNDDGPVRTRGILVAIDDLDPLALITIGPGAQAVENLALVLEYGPAAGMTLAITVKQLTSLPEVLRTAFGRWAAVRRCTVHPSALPAPAGAGLIGGGCR